MAGKEGTMLSLAEIRGRLDAAKAKGQDVLAAAAKQRQADDEAEALARAQKAQDRRLVKSVESQLRRLEPSELETLLAEFGGDQDAAEKAAVLMLKGIDDPDRMKHLRFGGWNISIGLRLGRIREIDQILAEAKAALAGYTSLPDGGEKDALVAETGETVLAIEAELAGYQLDGLLQFFRWESELHAAASLDQRQIVAEINKAITAGYLLELPAETAEKIVEEIRTAKAAGQEAHGQLFLRIMKYPVPKPELGTTWLGNFRCVTYAPAEDDRARLSRNRLLFHTLNSLWSQVLQAKKAARDALGVFRQLAVLTLAEAATGKSGVALAEISRDNPWRPKRFDINKKEYVPMTHRETGCAIENWGSFVVVVKAKEGERPTLFFPVLSEPMKLEGFPEVDISRSGMKMPLLKAGVWQEGVGGKLTPVMFKFFPGQAFEGLAPLSRDVFLERWQLWVLKAILRQAGGLEAPKREERPNSAKPQQATSEGGGYEATQEDLAAARTAQPPRAANNPHRGVTDRRDKSPRKSGGNGRGKGKDLPEDGAVDLRKITTADAAQDLIGPGSVPALDLDTATAADEAAGQ